MSASLDLLCDLLDEECSDVEQQDSEPDPYANTQPCSLPSPNPTNEAEADASSEVDPNAPTQAEEPCNEDDGEHCDEGDVETKSIEQQLLAMQQQMAQMQRLLEEKKNRQKSSEQPKRSPKQAALQPDISKTKGPNRFSEVDMFSVAGTSANLRSPTKTNPFKEDRETPRHQAKTYLKTPEFGPALPSKSTRVIQGEEKKRLLAKINANEKEKIALLKSDLADSSDEDEAKYPMQQNYNSYGKDIKKRLAHKRAEEQKNSGVHIAHLDSSKPVGFSNVKGSTVNLSTKSANKALPRNLFVEKFSKLRIANPVIEPALMDIHMLSKRFLPIYRIKEAIIRKENEAGDWVTLGALFYKSSMKSKNGNSYTMWKITDMQGATFQTVTVLLFGRSHSIHYKIPLNKAVGILNPKVLEDRSGRSDITLSVDHPDKVLELGDAIDLGKCAAKKQDGSGCTNLVNLNVCEYCEYHVKRAYKSISSKRGDLQSSFSGHGDVRARLMQKVDPKSQFFAGGQAVNSFASAGGSGVGPGGGIVAKPSAKQRAKDRDALAKLGVVTLPKPAEPRESVKIKPGAFTHLSSTECKAVKRVAQGVSLELGKKLLAPTPGAKSLLNHLTGNSRSKEQEEQRTLALLEKSQMKSASQLLADHKQKLTDEKTRKVLTERQKSQPQLGRGFESGFIDLGGSPSIKRTSTSSQVDLKMAKAVLALKGKPIPKSDPNYVPSRKRKSDVVEQAKSKVAKLMNPDVNDAPLMEKAQDEPVRTTSTGELMTKERIDAIKNRKSRFQNLVTAYEDDQVEKELDILEKKEAMEEKMQNTMELEVKAITCHLCNYTHYRQAEACRERGHKPKLIKVFKKFFECKNCHRRTTALDKYPKNPCSNCGGSAWQRTGMMKEKKGPLLDSERLLVRGVEQKFVGASVDTRGISLDMDL